MSPARISVSRLATVSPANGPVRSASVIVPDTSAKPQTFSNVDAGAVVVVDGPLVVVDGALVLELELVDAPDVEVAPLLEVVVGSVVVVEPPVVEVVGAVKPGRRSARHASSSGRNATAPLGAA